MALNVGGGSGWISGTEELRAVLARAPHRAQDALARALYREAHAIMNKSKRDYVPIDNAILKGSAVVAAPIRTGTGVIVMMGYGGAAKAYAVIQHENTALNHPPKNPRRRYTKSGRLRRPSRPGRAKYLSLAFDERVPEIPANLAIACDAMFMKAGL